MPVRVSSLGGWNRVKRVSLKGSGIALLRRVERGGDSYGSGLPFSTGAPSMRSGDEKYWVGRLVSPEPSVEASPIWLYVKIGPSNLRVATSVRVHDPDIQAARYGLLNKGDFPTVA